MTKDISIGSWAYTIGPYAKAPVDFETVCDRLEELGFNGVELGSFKPHPNPDDLPEKTQREELMERMQRARPCFQRHRGKPLGREADQHRRSVEVHLRVPQELRIRARSRHRRHSRRLRAAAHHPSRGRLRDRAATASSNTWKTCCDIAADNGQYVAWEFEPGFAFNKPSDIAPHSRRRRQAELRPACTTPATGRWSA